MTLTNRLIVLALLAHSACFLPPEKPVNDEGQHADGGSELAEPDRNPCVPEQPTTCVAGTCRKVEDRYLCFTPWPRVCKWHTCSTEDESTCETRPGTSGGRCVAVDGPEEGCCLYPQPDGGSYW